MVEDESISKSRQIILFWLFLSGDSAVERRSNHSICNWSRRRAPYMNASSRMILLHRPCRGDHQCYRQIKLQGHDEKRCSMHETTSRVSVAETSNIHAAWPARDQSSMRNRPYSLGGLSIAAYGRPHSLAKTATLSLSRVMRTITSKFVVRRILREPEMTHRLSKVPGPHECSLLHTLVYGAERVFPVVQREIRMHCLYIFAAAMLPRTHIPNTLLSLSIPHCIFR